MADNKKQDNQRPATEEIVPLSYDWERTIIENTVQRTFEPPQRKPDKREDNDDD